MNPTKQEQHLRDAATSLTTGAIRRRARARLDRQIGGGAAAGHPRRRDPREPGRRRLRIAGLAAAITVPLALTGAAAAMTDGFGLLASGALAPLPDPVAAEPDEAAFARLAAAAAASPQSGPDLGYVVSSWEEMAMSGGDGMADSMEPRVRTTWTGLDGSYRTVSTRPDGTQKCIDYPPSSDTDVRFPEWSDGEDVLAAAEAWTPHAASFPAWAIADLYHDQAGSLGDADPLTRAAIMTALADQGADYLGVTTGRSGEVVEVVSATYTEGSDSEETWLLFDPESAALVGWESRTTTTLGPFIFGSNSGVTDAGVLHPTTFTAQLPARTDCIVAPPEG